MRAAELHRLLARRWRLEHDASPAGRRAMRELDRRIRRRFERVLSVAVFDMSGFTRLTFRRGILHYLSLIRQMERLVRPRIRAHGGRVVKQDADDVFAAFPGPARALDAAIAVRSALDRENAAAGTGFEIYLSVGIGYGPLLDLGNDLWGSEFNLACKLGEDVADRGEILLTEAAWGELRARRGRRRRFERLALAFGEFEISAYKLKSRA